MRIKSYGSIKQEQITELETKLGFELPKDYAEFLMKYNGGSLNSSETKEVPIEIINETILIHVFFGYETHNNELDILFWVDFFSDEIYEGITILGKDYGGGYVIMICGKEDKGIWYWDVGCDFKQSSENKNVYKICDTFTELLEMLE